MWFEKRKKNDESFLIIFLIIKAKFYKWIAIKIMTSLG